MKEYREEFSNYNAFITHFEPVHITKGGKTYYVYYDNPNNYIQCGTKEYINGWLYGCVQTVCGQARRFKEDN